MTSALGGVDGLRGLRLDDDLRERRRSRSAQACTVVQRRDDRVVRVLEPGAPLVFSTPTTVNGTPPIVIVLPIGLAVPNRSLATVWPITADFRARLDVVGGDVRARGRPGCWSPRSTTGRCRATLVEWVAAAVGDRGGAETSGATRGLMSGACVGSASACGVGERSGPACEACSPLAPARPRPKPRRPLRPSGCWCRAARCSSGRLRRAVADGDQHDHRADADQDAEHGQRRAQLVGVPGREQRPKRTTSRRASCDRPPRQRAVALVLDDHAVAQPDHPLARARRPRPRG